MDTLTDAQRTILAHARRLLEQHQHSKHKLYSLHAPEVECISRGKAHKRYEFGVKANFATTVNEAFVVSARSFTGNPYDGHTLSEQLEQVSILCDQTPQEAYVDRGYKGTNTREIPKSSSRARNGNYCSTTSPTSSTQHHRTNHRAYENRC
ncbi:MAG: transposase [Candidatus Competibacteraceae bacterium]